MMDFSIQKSKITLTILLFFCVVQQSCGTRHFRMGRSKNGTLGAPSGEYVDVPPEQWFVQRLDHMTPADVRTFKQRYYTNASFFEFENPGPVFLMIGGEGPADPRWMVQGAWIEYALKFKALCFMLEHRYYGESHPLKDLSVKNLQYLTSAQALADLAYFIHSMNEKYRFNNEIQWVVFGGSYPGSLAAWMRLKYPHLVHAAISSSGPLLAKANFMEYFEVVVHALGEKTGGDVCVSEIVQARKEIETLIKTNPKEIEDQYKVCKPFESASSDGDMFNFFNSIADDFADLVQYNEDNRIGSDKRFKNLTINTVCDMLAGPEKPYKKLASFNSIMLEKSNEKCMDYSYENMIDEMKNVSWKGNTGARQWMYQTCTEFGFYQSSSGEANIFGNYFPVEYFFKQCIDIFGTKFNMQFIENAIDWTNSKYGGLNLSVDRIVFVHGSVDPWHALGITTTQDNDTPAIFIKGTAHCADMYPSNPNDPIELKEARVEIQQFLVSWLRLP